MDKITFKYKFPEDYNPHYVTGAYGGITDRAELVVNFYFERMAMPYSQTHEIIDGHLQLPGEVTPADLPNTRIRFIESGVVMNYKATKELHDWLGEVLKTMEDATKQVAL